MWRSIFVKFLRLRKLILRKDIYYQRQLFVETLSLGNKNASWVINPSLLSPESIIYSVGVGTDISFDLEVIKQFQSTIYAFDPTPKSIQWLKQQEIPAKFIFNPFGLAATRGKLDLFLPEQDNYVSGSIISDMLSSDKNVTVDMYDLSSIMEMYGHNHIDVLKMDIEGAEYEVIQDIINKKINVKQLLIEFHHRFPAIGIEKTRSAIKALNEVGYRIFDVSASGEEFSFIKV